MRFYSLKHIHVLKHVVKPRRGSLFKQSLLLKLPVLRVDSSWHKSQFVVLFCLCCYVTCYYSNNFYAFLIKHAAVNI